MSEPFLGEIKMAGFNFAPKGYAFCNGQILSIAQNSALFALLGTTYGGDGRVTFGLPNLSSRVPLHQGTGPGLSAKFMGEAAGTEVINLVQQQLPSHTHTVVVQPAASGEDADSGSPVGRVPAVPYAGGTAVNAYTATPSGAMAPSGTGSASPTGGNQPHNNVQPSLVVNFVIALAGIFPTRS